MLEGTEPIVRPGEIKPGLHSKPRLYWVDLKVQHWFICSLLLLLLPHICGFTVNNVPMRRSGDKKKLQIELPFIHPLAETWNLERTSAVVLLFWKSSFRSYQFSRSSLLCSYLCAAGSDGWWWSWDDVRSSSVAWNRNMTEACGSRSSYRFTVFALMVFNRFYSHSNPLLF